MHQFIVSYIIILKLVFLSSLKMEVNRGQRGKSILKAHGLSVKINLQELMCTLVLVLQED